ISNDFISLQNDTSLVPLLCPISFLRQAWSDAAATYSYTPYVAAAIIFIALTIPMTRFADWVQARATRRRRAESVA
ncbi:MAG: hypothetical protein ACKOW5_12695, partial [Actinomycetales bacterium]